MDKINLIRFLQQAGWGSLRIHSEANSKSRLKTTKYNFIVCFNRLWLLALNFNSGRVIGKTDICKIWE